MPDRVQTTCANLGGSDESRALYSHQHHNLNILLALHVHCVRESGAHLFTLLLATALGVLDTKVWIAPA